MSNENTQSTLLGMRIANMLRDTSPISARAAMKIASALIEEHTLRPVSAPTGEFHDSNDDDVLPSGSAR